MTSSNWKIPFGKKYFGKKIGLVPAQYLLWCAEHKPLLSEYPELREYIDANLRILRVQKQLDCMYEDEDIDNEESELIDDLTDLLGF